jgi:hypothetical protein
MRLRKRVVIHLPRHTWVNSDSLKKATEKIDNSPRNWLTMIAAGESRPISAHICASNASQAGGNRDTSHSGVKNA